MSAASRLAIAAGFLPRVRLDEPLSRHTSWHVGGPADAFFVPADAADLAAFLAQLPADVPVHFLGLGSNVLVRDGGLRGVVVSLHGSLDRLERLGDARVHADAGVPCARVARQCAKWCLGPAEFFAGIPGTVGGALAMNAGAWGGETWPHVVEVDTVDRAGTLRTRPSADFRWGYRHVDRPANDEWFVAARFEFRTVAEGGTDRIKALLERRRETQPIGEWSCGSTFTNPPGDHAARLIEAAGLKGHAIGGARVSTKHANFLVNEGEASAADVERLIAHVQATVERVHGVKLVPEVKIVGEPA